MANPSTPAVSAGPPFPPSAQLPIVSIRGDGMGYLTPGGLQLIQYLFAQIGGAGGVNDAVALSLLGSLAGAGGGGAGGDYSGLQPNQLSEVQQRQVSHSPIAWQPLVAGSTTPGAQTYSVQWGEACYIGPVVLVQFSVVMTALDGTTAGNVLISGLPALSQADAAVQAGWLSSYSNVTLPAGHTQLGVDLSAGSSDLLVVASGSAAGALPIGAAGLAANTALKGGCLFFR